MIEESYVSFDTAKMLKEAGFDVECDWFYINNGSVETGIVVRSTSLRDHNMATGFLSRPTQALAARWLREVNGIHVSSNIFMDSANDADGKTVDEWTFWSYDLFDNSGRIIEESDDRYDRYEESIEAGLKHSLELIKK